MHIKKLILHSAVQVPGVHGGEMKDQFVELEATANGLGIVLEVPQDAANRGSYRLAEGEEMEVLIPWAQIRVLYRRKEAPKK